MKQDCTLGHSINSLPCLAQLTRLITTQNDWEGQILGDHSRTPPLNPDIEASSFTKGQWIEEWSVRPIDTLWGMSTASGAYDRNGRSVRKASLVVLSKVESSVNARYRNANLEACRWLAKHGIPSPPLTWTLNTDLSANLMFATTPHEGQEQGIKRLLIVHIERWNRQPVKDERKYVRDAHLSLTL